MVINCLKKYGKIAIYSCICDCQNNFIFALRNFTFDECYVDGSRAIAKAAREAGVERLIHVSSLNANEESPSKFLQSKVQNRYEFFLIMLLFTVGCFGDFPGGILFGMLYTCKSKQMNKHCQTKANSRSHQKTICGDK